MTGEEKRENLFSEVLGGLVRIGTVTDRRMEERRVRVWFEDDGMSSGWLPVIISQDVTPEHDYDDPQWTELETEFLEPRQHGLVGLLAFRSTPAARDTCYHGVYRHGPGQDIL